MRPNMYKRFTSDAVQDNISHMLWILMSKKFLQINPKNWFFLILRCFFVYAL